MTKMQLSHEFIFYHYNLNGLMGLVANVYILPGNTTESHSTIISSSFSAYSKMTNNPS